MTISDGAHLTSFTIAPGAQWKTPCQVATFPAAWLEPLRTAYRRRPGVQEGWSLPTRRLAELLTGLDPAVIHVDFRLDSNRFIVAFPGADTEVLAAAVAAWAMTEVAVPEDETDWWELCQPADIVFHPETINLLEHGAWTNGTAAPADAMFSLLPTFLAQQVASQRMPLLDRRRDWILGPPQSDGRRSAVLWPPEKLEDAKTGGGFATAKITFHVETVPAHPVPSVHADLSISRFPLMPVSYVPARGDGPPGASIWLHAPDGFLREAEPHTLLSSPVWQVKDHGSETRRWQWKPGLATVLARLTHLTFPDPAKVFSAPGAAAEEGKIRAYVLYSEGSKSLAGDIDDLDTLTALDDAEQAGKARSLLHCANTGFVPRDHVEAHEQLTVLLEPYGIRPHRDLPRIGKKNTKRVTPREAPGQEYPIELWAQSGLTRDAVLATLEHHHHLTPAPDADDPDVIDFTGDMTLRVILKDVGVLGAGISRAEGDSRPQATLLQQHALHVARQIGNSPDARAAIFELEDDKYFARARKIDPKRALKQAFARTDRRLQCLRPGKLFTPSSKPWTSTKKPAPAPYPGTPFTRGTIYRASAAINDALRQLGRLGAYETPESLPDLEQIGIWLHHSGSTRIPIVLRLRPEGTAIAYLASGNGTAIQPIDYLDLAKALATGQGRITGGPRQKEQVAAFLRNALGIGDGTTRDTHDRVVFVRSASFRNWGWDWLQDKRIGPDHLVLPGVAFGDDEAPPRTLSPQECPGLRIIRVRDRSSTGEVARAFGVQNKEEGTKVSRVSGIFGFSDRVFYSINPRSDQMQTPLGVTKLDPDILRNFTAQAASPAPLEIFPAFLQPGDDPAAYAMLTSSLRRTYLHTEQATTFPALLHLCELADEYI